MRILISFAEILIVFRLLLNDCGSFAYKGDTFFLSFMSSGYKNKQVLLRKDSAMVPGCLE